MEFSLVFEFSVCINMQCSTVLSAYSETHFTKLAHGRQTQGHDSATGSRVTW
jgi:hypothetical protein